MQSGDLVILIAYATMDDAEARSYQPRIVFVDERNRAIDLGHTRLSCPPTHPSFCPAVTVLLAIDVRNTHTVVGLISGPRTTQRSCSSGEFAPNPRLPLTNSH
ncbi:aspartate 1-decarboxylase [Mycobacterium xenopi 3993]|nr:aspartate 1-decarboxylase [Mycobacterium xenopi 3993]